MWYTTFPAFIHFNTTPFGYITDKYEHVNIDMKGDYMNGEDIKKTEELNGSKETQQEGASNQSTEHAESSGNGSSNGQENAEQINLASIHDMLKEKDTKIDTLTSEIEALKKSNTELLLKVNSGANSKPPEDPFKVLYDEVANHI